MRDRASRKAYAKAYYYANKDRILENSRRRYELHKDEIQLKRKSDGWKSEVRYRMSHRLENVLRTRKYRKEHKDEIRERRAKWREEHREQERIRSAMNHKKQRTRKVEARLAAFGITF